MAYGLVNLAYWQLENKTFRPSYLRRLKTLMAQSFPPHVIGEDYIAAKIKEWKNTYLFLKNMHRCDDFTWDQNEKREIVKSTEVWNEYVQVS